MVVTDCAHRFLIRAAVLICVSLALIPARAADESKASTIGEQQYRVYWGDGTPASLDDVLTAARSVDVTFLGESHDDPVAHYLEADILRRLASKESSGGVGPARVILSLEMFERDVQLALDEYLGGRITEREFLDSSRPWKTYKADYRELIEFAKDHQIPVVAANAPSRYVNRVSRLGKASLEQLSKAARGFLPPLPYADASKAYEDDFKRVMEETEREVVQSEPSAQKGAKTGEKESKGEEAKQAEAKKTEPSHRLSNPRFALEAQSLWDATMAYSITRALKGHPGRHVLQVNGGFHSQYRRGILEHLERYRPRTKSVVVTMIPSKSFPAWDDKTMRVTGDFVVVTDGSFQRSARSSDDSKAQKKESPANGGSAKQ